jgi:hypothetical protein
VSLTHLNKKIQYIKMSERKIVKLNDVVSNITEFSMFRTRDNLIRPIFLIYSTDKDNIKNILEYLLNWISKPIKKISIDMLDTFKEEEINKNNTYIFNLCKFEIFKNESTIKNIDVNEAITSSIYNLLIDKAGPMIFIADNRFNIPTIFTSTSNAIFIDNVKSWSAMIHLNNDYIYEKDGVLVIDDMNSLNRLSVLKQF